MFRAAIASACLLASAGAAVAQSPQAPASTAATQQSASNAPVPRTMFIETMEAEFKRMDADRNGIVTKKEIEDFQRASAIFAARQRLVTLFQQLDSDKNGQLSPAEFAGLPMNIPQSNAAPVLAQVDGNHDGQVTIVEYRAGKLVSFDRMDTDKDGVVSVAEMKAAGIIR
jgi:Ca2+-binding EF-hand superfamily protein